MQHLRAILMLPVMAAVVIPAVILSLTGLDTFGLWQRLPASRFILPVLGAEPDEEARGPGRLPPRPQPDDFRRHVHSFGPDDLGGVVAVADLVRRLR